MKISLYTRVSDLIPVKETFFDTINDLIFRDPKRTMFKTHSQGSIFRQLKQTGVEGLELIPPAYISKKSIQEIKQILKTYDLKVFSIHQSNDNLLKKLDIAEIERLCTIANGFSANVIVLHINALKDKLVTELKEFQEKYKIKFGIENVAKNPFSKSYTYKGKRFSSLLNKLGLPITLDTTHLGQVEEDILKFYRDNKEKIVNIHLSDYKKNWLNKVLLLTDGTHLPLGEGELPIEDFLKLLKKENYQGLITMEINANLQKLCQSASKIREIFYSF